MKLLYAVAKRWGCMLEIQWIYLQQYSLTHRTHFLYIININTHGLTTTLLDSQKEHAQ